MREQNKDTFREAKCKECGVTMSEYQADTTVCKAGLAGDCQAPFDATKATNGLPTWADIAIVWEQDGTYRPTKAHVAVLLDEIERLRAAITSAGEYLAQDAAVPTVVNSIAQRLLAGESPEAVYAE